MCSCIECIGYQPEPPTIEEEMLELLTIVFDACEDQAAYSGQLGKVLRLNEATFDRIAELLNILRPRARDAAT